MASLEHNIHIMLLKDSLYVYISNFKINLNEDL
jgi:hypothetical protein